MKGALENHKDREPHLSSDTRFTRDEADRLFEIVKVVGWIAIHEKFFHKFPIYPIHSKDGIERWILGWNGIRQVPYCPFCQRGRCKVSIRYGGACVCDKCGYHNFLDLIGSQGFEYILTKEKFFQRLGDLQVAHLQNKITKGVVEKI